MTETSDQTAGKRVWTPAQIPDQSGRRALVTGVTSGIGEHTVIELARKGAGLILAARNKAKLEETTRRVREAVPGAELQPLIVDVSDLSSVRRAADEVTGPLHLLINNAGVMGTAYERTTDGFELQMATNYLGPFALTGLLLPRLVESGGGRVVAVSSQAHRLPRQAPLEDPRSEATRYGRWSSYARSKLADLMFVLELDERAREQGVPVVGLAAHPGYSATGLMGAGRNHGNDSGKTRWTATILQAVFSAVGQPADLGALPTLMAATADLPGSTYVGPSGMLQFKGHPRIVGTRPLAQDRDARRKLWELSEQATGVHFLDG
jgi:NAD(P)-dependent dehydrogenase (short-subunit alcohol dehydrogenase family)